MVFAFQAGCRPLGCDVAHRQKRGADGWESPSGLQLAACLAAQPATDLAQLMDMAVIDLREGAAGFFGADPPMQAGEPVQSLGQRRRRGVRVSQHF
jgi:hypothetical protein